MEDLYTICHNSFVTVGSKLNQIDNNKMFSLEFRIKDIKEKIAIPTEDKDLAKERLDILCTLLKIETILKETKDEIKSSLNIYDNYIAKWKNRED